MRIFKAALALSFLATVTVPVAAQDVSCTCTVPLGDVTEAIGRIDAGSGQVLASVEDGLAQAKEGQPLFLGSQVLTGANASAKISIFASSSAGGTGCKVNMGASSELALFATSEKLCAMLTRVEPAPAPAPDSGTAAAAGAGSTGGGSGAAALLALGGIAGIAGIAFGLSGGDSASSN